MSCFRVISNNIVSYLLIFSLYNGKEMHFFSINSIFLCFVSFLEKMLIVYVRSIFDACELGDISKYYIDTFQA